MRLPRCHLSFCRACRVCQAVVLSPSACIVGFIIATACCNCSCSCLDAKVVVIVVAAATPRCRCHYRPLVYLQISCILLFIFCCFKFLPAEFISTQKDPNENSHTSSCSLPSLFLLLFLLLCCFYRCL